MASPDATQPHSAKLTAPMVPSNAGCMPKFEVVQEPPGWDNLQTVLDADVDAYVAQRIAHSQAERQQLQAAEQAPNRHASRAGARRASAPKHLEPSRSPAQREQREQARHKFAIDHVERASQRSGGSSQRRTDDDSKALDHSSQKPDSLADAHKALVATSCDARSQPAGSAEAATSSACWRILPAKALKCDANASKPVPAKRRRADGGHAAKGASLKPDAKSQQPSSGCTAHSRAAPVLPPAQQAAPSVQQQCKAGATTAEQHAGAVHAAAAALPPENSSLEHVWQQLQASGHGHVAPAETPHTAASGQHAPGRRNASRLANDALRQSNSTGPEQTCAGSSAQRNAQLSARPQPAAHRKHALGDTQQPLWMPSANSLWQGQAKQQHAADAGAARTRSDGVMASSMQAQTAPPEVRAQWPTPPPVTAHALTPMASSALPPSHTPSRPSSPVGAQIPGIPSKAQRCLSQQLGSSREVSASLLPPAPAPAQQAAATGAAKPCAHKVVAASAPAAAMLPSHSSLEHSAGEQSICCMLLGCLLCVNIVAPGG